MERLTEIIDRILEKHDNLLSPTLNEAFEVVMANKELCREVFGDIFRKHIEMLIRQKHAQQRAALAGAPDSAISGDPTLSHSTIAKTTDSGPSKPSELYRTGLNIAYHKSLLNWPIAGGKLLRNAVKQDIEKQYKIYRDQAAPGVQRALWMRYILDNLPDATTKVGDVMDDYMIKNYSNMAHKELDKKLPAFVGKLEAPNAVN